MNCVCGRYDCESCDQQMQQDNMESEMHWGYFETVKQKSLWAVISDWFSVRYWEIRDRIKPRPFNEDEIPF